MRQFDTSSFKRLREAKGLTIRQLADLLGVRYQGVQMMEASGHLPTIRTLNKYLAVFPDLDESYFFENNLKRD